MTRFSASQPLARIAFVHIPKSGGTSLRMALAKRWRDTAVVPAWHELAKVAATGKRDMIAGHFKASALEGPTLAGYTPVTVLRDPFRRLLSAYHFAFEVERRGRRPLGASVAYAIQVSFAEFAFSAHGMTELHAAVFQLGLDEEDAGAWTAPLAQLRIRAGERLARMHAGTTERLQEFSDGLFRASGKRSAPPMLQRYKEAVDPADDGGLTRRQRAMLETLAEPGRALHRQADEQLSAWLDCLTCHAGPGQRRNRAVSP